MRILFVTSQPYLYQVFGGANFSTHQLCLELKSRGHCVSVLSGFRHGGWFEANIKARMLVNRILYGRKFSRDASLGYTTWRSWDVLELIPFVARKVKADIIVVGSGMMTDMTIAANSTGVPVILDLKDLDFDGHGADLKEVGFQKSVANSGYTAKKYKKAFGLDPVVIHPLIDLESYKVASSKRDVVFVNPVKEKGVDLVIGLAELCPHIPFTIVLGWELTDAELEELSRQVDRLSNVRLVERQKDMRDVLRFAKIVLVPSIREEAYGRIVTEAQISGIPVIASDISGLPEAVGAGGILLDPDAPLTIWSRALQHLWDDSGEYQRLSDEAIKQANRVENSKEYKVDLWEQTLRKTLNLRALDPYWDS